MLCGGFKFPYGLLSEKPVQVSSKLLRKATTTQQFSLDFKDCQERDAHDTFLKQLQLLEDMRRALVEVYNQLLVLEESPPPPAEYGNAKIWATHQQKSSAILCLRPPERQALPLSVLHDVFRAFHLDLNQEAFNAPTSMGDAAAATLAAASLCQSMGLPLENESTRAEKFQNCIRSVFNESWQSGCSFPPSSPQQGGFGMTSSLVRSGVHCIFCQCQAEFGNTGDAYMQVSRGYQLYVSTLSNTDKELLHQGAPAFLVCVVGKSIALGLRPVSSGELNSHH